MYLSPDLSNAECEAEVYDGTSNVCLTDEVGSVLTFPRRIQCFGGVIGKQRISRLACDARVGIRLRMEGTAALLYSVHELDRQRLDSCV